jgi:hypothetical protein
MTKTEEKLTKYRKILGRSSNALKLIKAIILEVSF